MRTIHAALAAIILASMATGAAAQAIPGQATPAQATPAAPEPAPQASISLSGPRIGITVFSPGIREKAEELMGQEMMPLVTQFGWQWERRFFTLEQGTTGVSEWVLLVGGLEQSLFIPSLTWVVGLRSGNGTEFGVGPNITPAGTALAIAAGVTYQQGDINFPVNLAAVPSRNGVRVSVLVGFNMREPPRTAAIPAP